MIINKKQFSEECDITASAINNLIKSGTLVCTKNGLIDTDHPVNITYMLRRKQKIDEKYKVKHFIDFAVWSQYVGKMPVYNNRIYMKSQGIIMMRLGKKIIWKDKPGWRDGELENLDEYKRFIKEVRY